MTLDGRHPTQISLFFSMGILLYQSIRDAQRVQLDLGLYTTMLSDWQPPKKHISPFGPDYILGPIRPQFDPVWEVAHMNFPFLNVSTCPLWAVYMQMIKWRPEKSQKNAMDQRNMETDKQIQGAKHTQKGAGFLCVKSRFTDPGGYISALFCIYTNMNVQHLYQWGPSARPISLPRPLLFPSQMGVDISHHLSGHRVSQNADVWGGQKKGHIPGCFCLSISAASCIQLSRERS